MTEEEIRVRADHWVKVISRICDVPERYITTGTLVPAAYYAKGLFWVLCLRDGLPLEPLCRVIHRNRSTARNYFKQKSRKFDQRMVEWIYRVYHEKTWSGQHMEAYISTKDFPMHMRRLALVRKHRRHKFKQQSK